MGEKELMQNMIARRAAKELTGPCIVNLGIGIPTLVAKYIDDETVFFHTENGLLGVAEVDEDKIDPNLVNAGKLPVGESIGASFFNSAESFAMIRGGHIDVAILGVLQVGQTGEIAAGKRRAGEAISRAADLRSQRKILDVDHVLPGAAPHVNRRAHRAKRKRRADVDRVGAAAGI